MSIDVLICGLSEIKEHIADGANCVLSIIDPREPEPVELENFDGPRLTLRFHDIIEPLRNLCLPELEHIEEIIKFSLDQKKDESTKILVHCHGGVSRSTAATTALLAHAYPDWEEFALFEHLESLRPLAWPNSRMIHLADDYLGRGGRLTNALTRFQAHRLSTVPELRKILQRKRRQADIDSADKFLKYHRIF